MNMDDRKELAKVHGSAALALVERLANIFDRYEAMSPKPVTNEQVYIDLLGTASYARDFLCEKCGRDAGGADQ